MFKDLGVGLGLRTPFYNQFSKKKPVGIDWVEVITENYLAWSSKSESNFNFRPLERLHEIRSQIPVALHGVSLSIGSVAKPNKDYLKCLRELIVKLEPCVVSDHLCWTSLGKHNSHDLLPLPYTKEALSHLIGQIQIVQDTIHRPLLLENPSSYVEFKDSEMPEWIFMSELAKRSGCGILLDINNVYVSSRNHNFNPLEYLKNIDPKTVGQIHLAGHLGQGELIIDTHDRKVCADVWKLYRWWLTKNGNQSTMIEWDSNLPSWSVLYREAQKISNARTQNNIKGSRFGHSTQPQETSTAVL